MKKEYKLTLDNFGDYSGPIQVKIAEGTKSNA